MSDRESSGVYCTRRDLKKCKGKIAKVERKLEELYRELGEAAEKDLEEVRAKAEDLVLREMPATREWIQNKCPGASAAAGAKLAEMEEEAVRLRRACGDRLQELWRIEEGRVEDLAPADLDARPDSVLTDQEKKEKAHAEWVDRCARAWQRMEETPYGTEKEDRFEEYCEAEDSYPGAAERRQQDSCPWALRSDNGEEFEEARRRDNHQACAR